MWQVCTPVPSLSAAIVGFIVDIGYMIAESIIAAASEIKPVEVPIVVRLQGTNSEAGLKLVSLKPCCRYN